MAGYICSPVIVSGPEEEGLHIANSDDCLGRSLLDFCDDYTVIDLETTGLSPWYDEIIEVAAIRVRDNKVVSRFQQLVKPRCEITEFVSSLTGITNSMVECSPSIGEVLPIILDYLGTDIIVGHNVSFDVNFLRAAVQRSDGLGFNNNYINTVRVARKVVKGLEHYRLCDLCGYYHLVQTESHRALADCEYTHQIYQLMKNSFSSREEMINALLSGRSNSRPRRWSFLDAREIKSTVPEECMDRDHPLYGRTVVFTGTLDRFCRKDAMQIVANLGGINSNSITKSTDYLVLGCNDYCSTIKDGKSTKQKKAEEYMLKGTGIRILDEKTFYEMIESGDEW